MDPAPPSSPGAPCTLDFEGRAVPARAGEPVACALLKAGHPVFARSVKYHRPRGPFCFDGACSQCAMRVDGEPNVYTCQVAARPGLRLERQNAFPTADLDVFRAVDWMFPSGLDHHEMLAGVPVAEDVMAKIARKLSGLGKLPDTQAPPAGTSVTVRAPVAIVGSGRAGLAAARTLAARGHPFLLIERRPEAELDLSGLAPEALRCATLVFGCYQDGEGPFLAALDRSGPAPRLVRLYAARVLFATGGRSELLPFANNDLPGVVAARAAVLLTRRHGLYTGRHLALVGEGEQLFEHLRGLEEAGVRVDPVIDLATSSGADAPPRVVRGEVLAAHGRSQVKALSYRPRGGAARRVRVEGIAVSLPAAANFELPRQAGARVHLEAATGTFAVEADEQGRTAARHVFAAGEVTGRRGAAECQAAGERAALAIAEER